MCRHPAYMLPYYVCRRGFHVLSGEVFFSFFGLFQKLTPEPPHFPPSFCIFQQFFLMMTFHTDGSDSVVATVRVENVAEEGTQADSNDRQMGKRT
mmetsp:Transcript_16196/g.33220  ORF Transcript_16196/g.33220 Transcript_16196/m.33220 type:complete len:95 (-) Transcript_16196:609-893(-)